MLTKMNVTIEIKLNMKIFADCNLDLQNQKQRHVYSGWCRADSS